MELSSSPVRATQKRTPLGRCKHFFWLGVLFDAAGASLMFAGVFAQVLYCDLLLYGGSVIIFFSLLWWVFWYTGNIELSPEEAGTDTSQVPPAALVTFLGLNGRRRRHRFSMTLGTISATFMRMRQQRQRRRQGDLQRPSSQNVIVKDRVETQRDRDAPDPGEASGGTPDFHRSGLPKAEAGRCSRAVRSPSPRAGRTHRRLPLPPAFSPSRSLPFGRSGSASPPLTAFTKGESPTLASPSSVHSPSGQPQQILFLPSNLSTVPLPNQPVVSPASGSQSAFSVSSQCQSTVPVTVQSYLEVTPTVPIQLQNPSQVHLNQSHRQFHHPSRGQPAATQVSLAPAATPGFPEQIAGPADLQGCPLISGPVSQPPDLGELFSPRDPFEQVFIKPEVSETASFDFPDPATGQSGDKRETP